MGSFFNFWKLFFKKQFEINLIRKYRSLLITESAPELYFFCRFHAMMDKGMERIIKNIYNAHGYCIST